MRPWWWARRSTRLARLLPPSSLDATCGDLLEEYAERCAARGRLRAEWWLAAELASLGRAYGAPPSRFSPTRWLAWCPRWRDLAHAARALRRTQWYAVTSATVLALGLSLSVTVFALVDGALFKPLPYPAADRLFALAVGYSQLPDPLRPLFPVSSVEAERWRADLDGAALTMFSSGDRQMIGTHEAVRSARVDAAFFDVLGMHPAIGGFRPDDFGPYTKIRPALLTDRLWRTRFNADPAVVGQTFVDTAETGEGIRVAGVLPPDFLFPYPDGVAFSPLLVTPAPAPVPGARGADRSVVVRIDASADPADAAATLNALVAGTAQARPAVPPSGSMSERTRTLRRGIDRAGLVPLRDALTARLEESAWVVFVSAAGLVLLACVNVMGLTVSRIRERRRELAVRRSLGASAGDIVRLLGAEHLLIALVGAVAGLAAASLALPWTAQFISSYLVIVKAPAIDGRVAAYTALVTLLCAVAATAVSARTATRLSFMPTAADGAGATRRSAGSRLLVATEVAMALLIAVAGSLVAGSLLRVRSENPGFDVKRTAVVTMVARRGASAADIDRLVRDIAAIAGVADAGGMGHLLLQRAFNGSVFDTPPGIADPDTGPGTFPIESIMITRGYFGAAGLQALDGRLPSDTELATGAPVVAVTELVARRYWPGQRAVGQRLMSRGRPFDVVGVVPDTRFMALDMEPRGEIYWSVAAAPSPSLSSVIIRLAPGGQIGPVANEIVRRCSGCWLLSAQMLTDAVGASIRARQFSAWIFSSFGVSALVIAGAGIFGLVAMMTKQRTREIGVRVALGATRGTVIRQIVREQLAAIMAGLLAGGLAAAWLTRFLTSYLYKTPVYDPWAWSAAVLMLIAVALAATLIPSRHAAAIDPIRALRVD